MNSLKKVIKAVIATLKISGREEEEEGDLSTGEDEIGPKTKRREIWGKEHLTDYVWGI